MEVLSGRNLILCLHLCFAPVDENRSYFVLRIPVSRQHANLNKKRLVLDKIGQASPFRDA